MTEFIDEPMICNQPRGEESFGPLGGRIVAHVQRRPFLSDFCEVNVAYRLDHIPTNNPRIEKGSGLPEAPIAETWPPDGWSGGRGALWWDALRSWRSKSGGTSFFECGGTSDGGDGPYYLYSREARWWAIGGTSFAEESPGWAKTNH